MTVRPVPKPLAPESDWQRVQWCHTWWTCSVHVDRIWVGGPPCPECEAEARSA